MDLAAMPPRSLLVNTSRSGLIAPGVLETEIARGRIHAAVDFAQVRQGYVGLGAKQLFAGAKMIVEDKDRFHRCPCRTRTYLLTLGTIA